MFVIPVTFSKIVVIEIVHDHDLELHNEFRSITNILMKSSHATPKLMVLATFAILATISKGLAVKICMTLNIRNWPRSNGKYANRKPINDLLFGGNSIIAICHYFQDILHRHRRNVHELDLDL